MDAFDSLVESGKKLGYKVVSSRETQNFNLESSGKFASTKFVVFEGDGIWLVAYDSFS